MTRWPTVSFEHTDKGISKILKLSLLIGPNKFLFSFTVRDRNLMSYCGFTNQMSVLNNLGRMSLSFWPQKLSQNTGLVSQRFKRSKATS